MLCPECERLESVVVRLGSEHAIKMKELRMWAATAPVASYDHVTSAANLAWRVLDAAEIELDDHKRTHAMKTQTALPG